MGRQERGHRRLPAVPLGAPPGGGPAERLGPGQHPLHRVREGGSVVQGGVPAVAHQPGQRRRRTGDHRGAAGQRLQRRQPERLGRAGRQDQVGAGLERGQPGPVGEVPEERHRQPGGPRPVRQPAAQRPVAGHHQRRVHAPPAQLGEGVQGPPGPLLG
nr:hypothetical protein [Streptomyces noursei]